MVVLEEDTHAAIIIRIKCVRLVFGLLVRVCDIRGNYWIYNQIRILLHANLL